MNRTVPAAAWLSVPIVNLAAGAVLAQELTPIPTVGDRVLAITETLLWWGTLPVLLGCVYAYLAMRLPQWAALALGALWLVALTIVAGIRQFGSLQAAVTAFLLAAGFFGLVVLSNSRSRRA